MIDCRNFSGYKPCSLNKDCSAQCSFYSPVKTGILIVHLGALGAVLRSTSLISSIKRKFPDSYITWVTENMSQALLTNISEIDEVVTTSEEELLSLKARNFDIAYVIDKDLKAIAISKSLSVKKIVGFTSFGPHGAIVPANPQAEELWKIGLSDHKKFYENNKSEQQLVHESLNLGVYLRDEYIVRFTQAEKSESEKRRIVWGGDNKIVIGLNTGCSATLPYKKLSLGIWKSIIERLNKVSHVSLVLLGGPEDTLRNSQLSIQTGAKQSSTQNGLRDGLISVDACDVIVTGDSLGMHMAIGLKKRVVAWFGPTCSQEIDLYDRGEKVVSEKECAPCWKRKCHFVNKCNEIQNVEKIVQAVHRQLGCLSPSTRRLDLFAEVNHHMTINNF